MPLVKKILISLGIITSLTLIGREINDILQYNITRTEINMKLRDSGEINARKFAEEISSQFDDGFFDVMLYSGKIRAARNYIKLGYVR